MKNILISIISIIFLCLSCKSGKISILCTENKKFKEEFFSRINIIEQNISLNQDSLFRSSLIFLSNYAPVSFYETVNYARIYPLQALERDKKIWNRWYEENKCKNLQLKNNYPIPEQYQEFFKH